MTELRSSFAFFRRPGRTASYDSWRFGRFSVDSVGSRGTQKKPGPFGGAPGSPISASLLLHDTPSVSRRRRFLISTILTLPGSTQKRQTRPKSLSQKSILASAGCGADGAIFGIGSNWRPVST